MLVSKQLGPIHTVVERLRIFIYSDNIHCLLSIIKIRHVKIYDVASLSLLIIYVYIQNPDQNNITNERKTQPILCYRQWTSRLCLRTRNPAEITFLHGQDYSARARNHNSSRPRLIQHPILYSIFADRSFYLMFHDHAVRSLQHFARRHELQRNLDLDLRVHFVAANQRANWTMPRKPYPCCCWPCKVLRRYAWYRWWWWWWWWWWWHRSSIFQKIARIITTSVLFGPLGIIPSNK